MTADTLLTTHREPYTCIKENLGLAGVVKREVVQSPSGTAGVALRWGEHIPLEMALARLLEINPVGWKLATEKSVPMFAELYQASRALNRGQRRQLEVDLATGMIVDAIKAQGLQPQDISFLMLGSGTPISPEYAYFLARNAGLTISRERTGLVAAACNSGGEAMRQALVRFPGQTGLVAAIEGMTGLPEGPIAKRADWLSTLTFSDGAACIPIGGGETAHPIRLLASTDLMVFPDERGNLAATMTYGDRMPPEAWVHEDNGNTYVRLPKPGEGMLIDMKGGDTAKMFIRIVGKLLAELTGRMALAGVDRNSVTRVISHVPSNGLWPVLELAYKKAFPNAQVLNLIDDGNSSASTFLINTVRQLPGIQPGEVVANISFGAGASASGFITQY